MNGTLQRPAVVCLVIEHAVDDLAGRARKPVITTKPIIMEAEVLVGIGNPTGNPICNLRSQSKLNAKVPCIFGSVANFLAGYSLPSLRTHLCCEFRKDLEWRAVVICKLVLADHMCDFDACDCC